MTAIPSIADVCKHPTLPEDMRIRFPGGTTLQIPSTKIPDPGDIAAQLISMANSALAPLMPLLDMVEALLSAKKVFDAIKSNPFSVVDAVSDFAKKIDKLKQLLPPVSIPPFTKDVIKAIRIYLEDIRNQLQAIVAEQSRLQIAQERAAALGIGGLAEACSCAAANLDAHFAGLKLAGGPINRILQLVNLVASLAGLPELPGLTMGLNAAASVQPLTDLVEALRSIENVIPA